MKKGIITTVLMTILISVLVFSLSSCQNPAKTLDNIRNEFEKKELEFVLETKYNDNAKNYEQKIIFDLDAQQDNVKTEESKKFKLGYYYQSVFEENRLIETVYQFDREDKRKEGLGFTPFMDESHYDYIYKAYKFDREIKGVSINSSKEELNKARYTKDDNNKDVLIQLKQTEISLDEYTKVVDGYLQLKNDYQSKVLNIIEKLIKNEYRYDKLTKSISSLDNNYRIIFEKNAYIFQNGNEQFRISNIAKANIIKLAVEKEKK